MYTKIIEDVLFYLPEWGIKDKTRNKKHKPVNPFLEKQEELPQHHYRKTITEQEILHAHRLATTQALSYMYRTKLPRDPLIDDAICMWAAGLLEKKYKFKEVNDDKQHYYQLNLIRDAKQLLEPYITVYFRPLHRRHRRDPYYTAWENDDEYHEHPPPRSKPKPRLKPSNVQLETEATSGDLGETIQLTTRIYDKYHNPYKGKGKVKYYIETPKRE